MPLTARKFALILSICGLLPSHAFADDCEERFKALLINGNGDGPVKIHVTQEIVGGMVSKNYFYQSTPGHWMSEMIEPANMQWSLTYNNAFYSSPDQGKSWNKIRDVESDKDAAAAKENTKKNAETVRDVTCSQEDLDGVVHQTLEGRYNSVAGFKSENLHKYWVNPETNFIRKAFYHMKADNFESKTTQLLEKAPDLALPEPK